MDCKNALLEILGERVVPDRGIQPDREEGWLGPLRTTAGVAALEKRPPLPYAMRYEGAFMESPSRTGHPSDAIPIGSVRKHAALGDRRI